MFFGYVWHYIDAQNDLEEYAPVSWKITTFQNY